MLELSLRPPLRRVVALAALLAYALPLSLGAVSQVAHRAVHLMEQLQERQARAAALGMVHLATSSKARSTFTHTHDGVTHSHASTVGGLLAAADRSDQDHDEATVPLVQLSAHTPAAGVDARFASAVYGVYAAAEVLAPDHPRPLPPLPPPRV